MLSLANFSSCLEAVTDASPCICVCDSPQMMMWLTSVLSCENATPETLGIVETLCCPLPISHLA